jgi:hypothetical protein
MNWAIWMDWMGMVIEQLLGTREVVQNLHFGQLDADMTDGFGALCWVRPGQATGRLTRYEWLC